MRLAELTERLDTELRTDDFADLDASANGLQVGPQDKDVSHVAVAVDGVAETFERAADAGADALVVHHGLSWGGFDRVTGNTYDRIAALVENDIALYVSHLPLDGHQSLGNAAGVANVLGLDDREPFGEMGPEHIGTRGHSPIAYDIADVREELQSTLETAGEPVQVLDFGPDTVEDIAIVTGSGVDWIGEAARKGVDALVTGEGKQQAYHDAQEAGIHVVLAGHYATETFGVLNLAAEMEDLGLETTFIDCPTGL